MDSDTHTQDYNEDWKQIPTHDSIPPYSIFTKPIEKASKDDKDYRIIRLENGVHAMVVHDEGTDKAAASMDVSVGFYLDPDDLPGLAHFCEHLMFMGTEQFPRENDYAEFLSKNNGSSNAYTTFSSTNYYFDVAAPALHPALTRFAAFFHSPLFSSSCTFREVNAVDSEFKQNIPNDSVRLAEVDKRLCKEGHPYKKFGCGNKQSLLQLSDDAEGGPSGPELRRRLVEWWEEQYCAGRMKLCVIGKDSLDELSDMVSTLFSPIQNRKKHPFPLTNEHPYGPDELGTLIHVQSLAAIHAIQVTFPLKYQPPDWRYKHADLLSHFIGHEGPGSLCSYLKKKGWITTLDSGLSGSKGFDFFSITIMLTEDGFACYLSVLKYVFKFISLLKESSISSFHQSEVSKITRMLFDFADRVPQDSYAIWISRHLSWPAPPELTLTAPQTTWDWEDPEYEENVIKDLLSGFTLDKARVMLMARKEDHEKSGRVGVQWEKEPWFGAEYCVEKWEKYFIDQTKKTNDIEELHLPEPNPYIPKDLAVTKTDMPSPQKRPRLVHETSISSLWYKTDDQFWLPKSHATIEIRSPLANKSPRACVLTRLFVDIYVDAFEESTYNAELAGLSSTFGADSLGVYFVINGYTDKLSMLTQYLLKSIKSMKVNTERLEIMKDELQLDYKNFYLSSPHQVSGAVLNWSLREPYWSLEETLREVPDITAHELQDHITNLLSEVKVQTLLVGNMSEEDAISLIKMTEAILDSRPLSSPVFNKALIPLEKSNYVISKLNPNVDEPNCSITYYIHIGKRNDRRLRVTADILSQILSEPAFNILRTKEQLGYVVYCSERFLAGSAHFGLQVVVQSEKEPEFLEERVETFFEEMKGVIEEMDLDTFEEQKASLGKAWMETDKSLDEEVGRFWAQIETGHLDFCRREYDTAFLKNVTKDEVLDLFMRQVHPSSTTRSKLSVHLRSSMQERVSPTAAGAFESLVKDAKLAVKKIAWKQAFGDELPVVAEFRKYWEKVFTEANVDSAESTALFEKLPALVEQSPVENDSWKDFRKKVEYVEDLKKFRSLLGISDEPKSVAQWDEVVSKRYNGHLGGNNVL
ncbi:hypothetical protein SERLADRAFT_363280 [Serpula lacrymans var. lacrymans S7.9]|uniref:Insulin-degrading enzyme n=1 Tax=Serpula lacrymans var. lacrymans (strain S7.9) TaxID=578457 RepID=F8P6W7_SERL9|nr:uncharacterized protein SERLADRAFT_363280 [Serpula lacrymans var. lacrymans S7.9]EGO21183.1 hypothetical protein SERLADRAFT_363280 [Serpula lacrymans var. lacrymans S7.9]